MNRKIERVNSVLRRELSALITQNLRDPRIASWIAVSRVSTTRDLDRATVWITVHGEEGEAASTVDALISSAGALRHMLKDRIRIRHVPQLFFKIDEDSAQAEHVLDLLDQVAAEPPLEDDGASSAAGSDESDPVGERTSDSQDILQTRTRESREKLDG